MGDLDLICHGQILNTSDSHILACNRPIDMEINTVLVELKPQNVEWPWALLIELGARHATGISRISFKVGKLFSGRKCNPLRYFALFLPEFPRGNMAPNFPSMVYFTIC